MNSRFSGEIQAEQTSASQGPISITEAKSPKTLVVLDLKAT